MAFGSGLLSLGGGGGGVGSGGDLWSDPVDSNIVPDGAGTRGIGSSTLQMGTIWGTSIIAKQGALTIRNASTNILQSAASGDLGTLPSASSYSVGTFVPDAATDGFAMFSPNDASAGSTSTKSMRWETGNKTAGDGDSGSFTFQPGNSSGGNPGTFHVNGGFRTTLTTLTTTANITTAMNHLALDGTSGSFTVTLPSAVGIKGKAYSLRKTDAGLANIISIATDGSETIDGDASTTLNTLNENLDIISDGANWQILRRDIPSVWTIYTPAYTGFGTVPFSEATWRRVGDSLEVRALFVSGTSTAVEARMSLPTGLTSAGTDKILSITMAGSGYYTLAVAAAFVPLTEPSKTYITMGVQQASTAGIAKALGNGVAAPGVGIGFTATIPITGWEG